MPINFKLARAAELPTTLALQLEYWKDDLQTIVLATGVFDLLHHEHEIFLKKAKAAGGKLLVGLESDARVRKIKGAGRPVNHEVVRLRDLEKLGLADWVFILPDDFSSPLHHRQLIKAIRPDILAVSSHTKHLDKKQAILEEFGGRVEVVHQHNPDISTTLLIEQMQAESLAQ